MRSLCDLAIGDKTSCDGPDLGDFECLLNVGGASDFLFLYWLQHTLDAVLDIVDGIVDY